jgi:hypothetical protein
MFALAAVLACNGSRPESTPAPPPNRDAAPAPALPVPNPAFELPPPSDPIVDLATTGDACVTRKSGHVDCVAGSDVERIAEIDDAIAVRADDAQRCVLRRSSITCFDLGYDPKPPQQLRVANAVALHVGYPSCAVRADHTAVCWFRDEQPAPIPHLRDVTAITGNGEVTCATRGNGDVTCTDAVGAASPHAPWRRAPLAHVRQLALGDGSADDGALFSEAYARFDDGSVRALEITGNTGKQLAIKQGPPITELQGATAIAMHDRSLVAIVGGRVVTIDGDEPPRTLPTLRDAVAISQHCALRAQGSVVCWGDAPAGQPWRDYRDKVATVVGVADVVSVATNQRESWAVVRDGRVFHWGDGEVGWAVPLASLHDATAVAIADSGDPCFVRKDRGVTCLADRGRAPVDMKVAQIVELRAGEGNMYARRADGALLQWQTLDIGNDNFGGITTLPQEPTAGELAGGMGFECARDGRGGVRCGHPPCVVVDRKWRCTVGKLDPVAIPPAAQVVVVRYAACAVLEDGEVSCWGRSSWGTLGRRTANDNDVMPPTVVPGIHGAVALSDSQVGFEQEVCAARRDGSLTCWGGRDPTYQILPPRQILPPGSVTGRFVGGRNGCQLRRDGLVTCWGSNSYGRVGDGSIIHVEAPVAVPGLR